MMQARWGSHGHYEIIALVPSSAQEMFDFTIRAFNLSEQYRIPVIIMADEVVGHMTERVVIPSAQAIKLIERRKPGLPPGEYRPYHPGKDWVSPMANCGDGYRIHITGLTHGENGYPGMDEKTQANMVNRLIQKIVSNRHDIIRTENINIDDAEVVVVAYGISARSAKQAVREARDRGMRAGLIKLETVWPFPEELIRTVASRIRALIIPEINAGQIAFELQRCAEGKCSVQLLSHYGGSIIHPGTILDAIAKYVKDKKGSVKKKL
jgi:2-oxoglutarate ferredoxin oxidoreductase subunit alpha